MISTGLKKLALENGMKVANGVAYGTFRDYSVGFWDGSGTKSMIVCTKFADADGQSNFEAGLGRLQAPKEYRVRELNVLDEGIVIVFNDTVGTLKKMNEFFDVFFPLLDSCGATHADVCSTCGQSFDGSEQWVLVNGVPLKLHRACRDRMQADIRREKTAAEENDTGSYGSGAVGALLGSVAGAIVWALIFLLGRIAAIGGIVIAWLSAKGYDLLHGKQGKGKIVIVLILSLLGVLLGTFGGYYAEIVKEIVSGELAGYTVGQVPGLIATLFLLSPEFKAEFIKNLAIGFVIAAVGIFLILKNTHDGLKGSTIKDLP